MYHFEVIILNTKGFSFDSYKYIPNIYYIKITDSTEEYFLIKTTCYLTLK